MHSLLALALAQVPPPSSPPPLLSPWLSPGVVLSALGLLVSAIIAIVTWSVVQDRRIEKRATTEALDAAKKELALQIAAIRDAIVDLGKMIAAAQPRGECVGCRRELEAKVATLHDEVREKPTKASVNQAFEELRALTDRVVAGEKVALKLEGKVDAALAALVDLKASIAKLDGKIDKLAERRGTLRPGEKLDEES